MTRSNFLRWTFNDQQQLLDSDEAFRRLVCESLDDMENEAGARFLVLGAILLIQTAVLGLILWRVW